MRSSAGLECLDVVLGKQGLVVKTSSGKVSRLKCRQQYLDGSTPKGIILYNDRKASGEFSGWVEPFPGASADSKASFASIEDSVGKPVHLPGDPASSDFIPQKICVVGAGPAGMVAAYELHKMGHTVRLCGFWLRD